MREDLHGDGEIGVAQEGARMTASVESTEPAFNSIEEAEEERLSLLEEIQDIERQLGERAAQVNAAGWLPDTEYVAYRDWRSRAVAARFHLLNEMRDVKEYIKTQRRHSSRPGGGESIERLRQLLRDALVALDDIGIGERS